jgi:hypothetical protein
MNVADLQNLLANLKTAVPVSIDLVSEDKSMRKTNNPNVGAVKCVTLNGIVGMSYENAVNNQLGREDKDLDFEAQRPAWLVRLGRNLGTNKAHDRVYVPIKVQSASKPVYLKDGVDVTDQVQPFLRKSKAPKTQDGVDKKIVWRTPALDNIYRIRINGIEATID